MKVFIPGFLLLLLCQLVAAQADHVVLKVVNPEDQPLPGATVELIKKENAALVKVQVADSTGSTDFNSIGKGEFMFRISHAGYTTGTVPYTPSTSYIPVVLQRARGELAGVTISARKPFIQLEPGKTVVNLDAMVSNAGTSAMEALEKMPGITVDKDGNISLKGRAGVSVMIDGKPTHLDQSQLATLLTGMSSNQIQQVEIMDQPPAKYDAAGNAGIINIKTKKNLQRGFNGSVSTAYSQGVYPKNNNSLQLNYRSGKWNLFANYSNNFSRSFTEIYALRTYYDQDKATVAILEQFSNLKGTVAVHNLRAGADLSLSSSTSMGFNFTGLALNRNGESNNPAYWMNPLRQQDSSILTTSRTKGEWTNAGGNFNFKHAFSNKREITADVDAIRYNMDGEQYFENQVTGQSSYSEAHQANLPSNIKIFSGKADYSEQLNRWKWETGFKLSHIATDNLANYVYRNSGPWQPDYGKTNHFLYNENIQAVYASAETSLDKWKWQAGLRYEATSYDGQQLGNAMQKDSSFSRSYSSLFPSFHTSFDADSSNSFSFSAGRRIDRPAFQKLNPFVLIINKYTYQQGNPYFKPQFTWNFELSHLYKNTLVTTLGYSLTTDYFSQIFPIDPGGLVIYTEGNLDRLQHFTLSVGAQLSPAKWWSLSSQAVLVHKTMEGVIGKKLEATVTQLNLNLNNQFRFSKGWAGEISGFYTSRSQNDIQEIVDPAGQLTAGISKSVINNKGTIRFAVRDIFYTQWMKGNTFFPLAHEYFKLTRDTRVASVSFSYRFGKSFKTTKRSQGAAGEEIQRVGNG